MKGYNTSQNQQSIVRTKSDHNKISKLVLLATAVSVRDGPPPGLLSALLPGQPPFSFLKPSCTCWSKGGNCSNSWLCFPGTARYSEE